MKTNKLTPRQAEILQTIQETVRERGYPPSIREIGQLVGIHSSAGVWKHLQTLVEKGYIDRVDKLSRGIRLTARMRGIPLLGRVAAGQPVLSEANIIDYLPLEKSWFSRQETYALEVQGDSMINAGIHSGDCLIVEVRDTLQQNEIGVFSVDGEMTVKRFQRRGKEICLIPENSAFTPIVISAANGNFRILGKVVGLVRKQFT